MAFTKDEHENLLKEIAMSGGDTDNMLKLLQKLRDDFDEREGMLKKDGETRDKETPSTEKERNEIREESREDNKEDNGERRDPLTREEVEMEDRRGASGITDSIEASNKAQDTVSRSEFDALRRKYIERFFGSGAEAIEDNKEDVRKDDDVKNLTFDDLFKDREGMK